MIKPFTLHIKEVEEDIISKLNDAKIPYYVSKIILKDIYNIINDAENEEIQNYCNSISNEVKESDQ
jgi:hypothetical protein